MKNYFYILTLFIALTFTACSSTQPTTKQITFKNFPLHFIGVTPGANCEIKYQLDIFSDNVYFLRELCLKNGVSSKTYDDIGRWDIEAQNRLLLKGSKERPRYFYLLDENNIELMDLEGKKIDSKLNYTLKNTPNAISIEPTLFMSGMYSYIADSANFTECNTRKSFSVSFTKEHLALESAYLKTKIAPGQELKVTVEGSLKLMEGVDEQGLIPTLVVEKFINIIPKEVCQHPYSGANLTNTYWKLTRLNTKPILNDTTQNKEAYIVFNDSKIQGNSGCNSIRGSYTLDGDKISLSDKGMMMTRMFCRGSKESEFLQALHKMYNYKIKGEYLEVFDKDGIQLMRFESVYIY